LIRKIHYLEWQKAANKYDVCRDVPFSRALKCPPNGECKWRNKDSPNLMKEHNDNGNEAFFVEGQMQKETR